MLSDLEIAQQAEILNIKEIAKIIILPTKTSLSDKLFRPKSSIIPAPNSVK